MEFTTSIEALEGFNLVVLCPAVNRRSCIRMICGGGSFTRVPFCADNFYSLTVYEKVRLDLMFSCTLYFLITTRVSGSAFAGLCLSCSIALLLGCRVRKSSGSTTPFLEERASGEPERQSEVSGCLAIVTSPPRELQATELLTGDCFDYPISSCSSICFSARFLIGSVGYLSEQGLAPSQERHGPLFQAA